MPMTSSVSWSAGPTGTPFEPSKGYSGGGNGSVLFDGNDYLQVNTGKFYQSDFTIEAWVYFNNNGEISNRGGLWQFSNQGLGPSATSTRNLAVGVYQASGTGHWLMYAGNSSNTLVEHDSGVDFNVGQWQHVAQVHSDGTTRLYVDGTQILSVSDNLDYYYIHGIIGGYYNSTYLLNDAYLSNFRLIYRPLYTSNFTPPTTKLNPGTRETDARLLTCFNTGGTILDASIHNRTITVNGNPTPSSVTPF